MIINKNKSNLAPEKGSFRKIQENYLKETFTWENRQSGERLPTLEDYQKLKEGTDIDTAYNELHDALVNVKKALKQNGDNNAFRSFLKWWDQLDRFYPKKK